MQSYRFQVEFGVRGYDTSIANYNESTTDQPDFAIRLSPTQVNETNDSSKSDASQVLFSYDEYGLNLDQTSGLTVLE